MNSNVVSCTANPSRVCGSRFASTRPRALSSSRKQRSSSAVDGGLAKQPYVAACSSVRNSTGTENPQHATDSNVEPRPFPERRRRYRELSAAPLPMDPVPLFLTGLLGR
jgi:hypothetical protein